MKYFLAALLICSNLYAQDLQFEDIENAPINLDSIELSENEAFDIVDALSQQQEAVKQARTRFVDTSIKIDKKNERPAPFLAVIPKGVVITRLSDSKDFYLPRRLQTLTQLTYAGSPETLILNKDGIPTYVTKTIHVVSIESDLKLTPEIDPKITYTRGKHAVLNTFDKKMSIRTDLAWELEQVSSNYWNQTFNQDLDNFSATRASAKVFYRHEIMPVEIGLGFSYQQAKAENDFFKIDWSALFIGPQISYTAWQDEDTRLEFEIGAAAATLSDAQTFNYNYSPSAYEWGMMAKIAWDTWAGTIFSGLQYRQTYLSLNQASDETNLSAEKETQASWSLQIGYRMGFEL